MADEYSGVKFTHNGTRWVSTPEYSQWYYRNSWPQRQIVLKRSRSKKLGVPFNLDASDLTIPETCPVLGIPIFFSDGNGPKDNSPSIDKIIPRLGYVKGNVVVISLRANRIKNDATLGELKKVYEWLKKTIR